jgi:hypothetical protein
MKMLNDHNVLHYVFPPLCLLFFIFSPPSFFILSPSSLPHSLPYIHSLCEPPCSSGYSPSRNVSARRPQPLRQPRCRWPPAQPLSPVSLQPPVATGFQSRRARAADLQLIWRFRFTTDLQLPGAHTASLQLKPEGRRWSFSSAGLHEQLHLCRL